MLLYLFYYCIPKSETNFEDQDIYNTSDRGKYKVKYLNILVLLTVNLFCASTTQYKDILSFKTIQVLMLQINPRLPY